MFTPNKTPMVRQEDNWLIYHNISSLFYFWRISKCFLLSSIFTNNNISFLNYRVGQKLIVCEWIETSEAINLEEQFEIFKIISLEPYYHMRLNPHAPKLDDRFEIWSWFCNFISFIDNPRKFGLSLVSIWITIFKFQVYLHVQRINVLIPLE